MDFLKKFFENIYLYLTTTITGYFAALWLTLRHPILGPQYLARAHSGDRAVIDPFLFMFLTACAFMVNIFAFDLTRSDLLGPLTAGKAGPKLYMVALSAFAFTIVVTSVVAVLRKLVRLRNAQFFLPQSTKAWRRSLRRRRWVRLPDEAVLTTNRLAALPYVLPASIVYFMAFLVLCFKFQSLSSLLFLTLFYGIADLFPRTAITVEFYALTDFAIPFAISYGLLLATWVQSLFFAPAFLPMARTLFYPTTLSANLPWVQKVKVLIGASFLSTTIFAAFFTGIATYLWLSGPKPQTELAFSELVCDMRNLPDVTAAVYFKNTNTDPIVLTDDAISIFPMKRKEGPEKGDWSLIPLSGEIPMRVTRIAAITQDSFFAIPAASEGLITLRGYFDLQEPYEIGEGEKFICGIEVSGYLSNNVALYNANSALQGRVLVPPRF